MKPYTPDTSKGRTVAGDDIHHGTADTTKAWRTSRAKRQKHSARQHGKRLASCDLAKMWCESLNGAVTMPPCPACGGAMVDDSHFIVSGAKCTVCTFSSYEAPVA